MLVAVAGRGARSGINCHPRDDAAAVARDSGTQVFALRPRRHTSLVEAVPREQSHRAGRVAPDSTPPRAVGPAIAGAIVRTAGAVASCSSRCSSRSPSGAPYRAAQHLPPSACCSAARCRCARHSPVVKASARTILFVGAPSGIWALLPVLARDRLHLDIRMAMDCCSVRWVPARWSVRPSDACGWSMNRVGGSARPTPLGRSVTAESSSTVLALRWVLRGQAGPWRQRQPDRDPDRYPAMGFARAIRRSPAGIPGCNGARQLLLWGTVATHAGIEGALLASVAVLLAVRSRSCASCPRVLVMQRRRRRRRCWRGEAGHEAADCGPGELRDSRTGSRPSLNDGPAARAAATVRSSGASIATSAIRTAMRNASWCVVNDYLRQRARATAADRVLEERAVALHVHDARDAAHAGGEAGRRRLAHLQGHVLVCARSRAIRPYAPPSRGRAGRPASAESARALAC